MEKIKLINQHRTGLFDEDRGVTQGPHNNVRLTIPAREALEKAGAKIIFCAEESYMVELRDRCPRDLVAVRLMGSRFEPNQLAVRLEYEPPYPNEIKLYWDQVDFLPCPICGAPLVWCEVGYVPEYRVCAVSPHHHIRVDVD